MNFVQAEMQGVKRDNNYVLITITDKPTLAAKMLRSQVSSTQIKGYVQVWVDFHGQKRFLGFQNPLSMHKLVHSLYSAFMTADFYRDDVIVDMETLINENVALDFSGAFDTVQMDL